MKNFAMILVLCVCLSSMTLTYGIELIINGDFETGSTTGYWMPASFDSPPWSRFTWGGNETNSWLTDGGGNNDGGVVGIITPENMAIKNRWSGSGIVQTVPATAGSEYTFSFDGYNSATADTATDFGFDLKVNFRDAAAAWIGDVIQIARYDAAVETPGSWVTVSGSLVAPAGTADLEFRIIATGDGGGGYIYADNASVQSYGMTNPSPADGLTVDPAAVTQVLCDIEVSDSNSISYDVYWGVDLVDPNITDLTILSSGSTAGPTGSAAAAVTLATNHTYHWAVSAVHNGTTYVGPVWTFSSINDAPTADAGGPIVQNVWLLGGSASVSLEGTASDDGLPTPANLTTLWSSDPLGVSFTDAMSLVTDATFTSPGIYALAITADDGAIATASDAIIVRVYAEGDDGLVALYEFEGDATDSVGGHDGTLIADVNLPAIDTVDTQVGTGSLSLTEDGQEVQILDSGVAEPNWLAVPGAIDEVVATWADFTTTNQVTTSAWIKVDEWAGSWQHVVFKDKSYGIIQNADSTNTTFKIGSSNVESDPRGEISARDIDEINILTDDGNWHQIVGTYDGLKLCIYVDGVLEKLEWKTDYLDSMPLGGGYLVIGEKGNMRIDQVRLHDIALSEEMILAQFIADGGTSSCRQQYAATDLDQDCYIGLGDMAIMASEWLNCSDISNPTECN